MQAIRTRYHSPSNTRGSYISAKCEAGAIRFSYNHSLNVDGNHLAAMQQLRAKLQWDTPYYTEMAGGGFAGDMYWVFTPKPKADENV